MCVEAEQVQQNDFWCPSFCVMQCTVSVLVFMHSTIISIWRRSGSCLLSVECKCTALACRNQCTTADCKLYYPVWEDYMCNRRLFSTLKICNTWPSQLCQGCKNRQTRWFVATPWTFNMTFILQSKLPICKGYNIIKSHVTHHLRSWSRWHADMGMQCDHSGSRQRYQESWAC